MGLTQIACPAVSGRLVLLLTLPKNRVGVWSQGQRLKAFFLVLRRMVWLTLRLQMGNLLETWAFRIQASTEEG